MNVQFICRSALVYLLYFLVVFVITGLGLFFTSRSWRSESAPEEHADHGAVGNDPRALTQPHPLRERLTREVSLETTEESVKNLASYFDYSMAVFAFDSMSSGGSCEEAIKLYPRPSRVRKLVAQIGAKDRDRYAKSFIGQIRESMHGYVECVAVRRKAIMSAEGGVLILPPTPDLHDRKRATASALSYILAEWDRPDALDAYAFLLREPDPIPANRLFLIYSAHVIIAGINTDGISQEKRAKLQSYRNLTKAIPVVGRTPMMA